MLGLTKTFHDWIVFHLKSVCEKRNPQTHNKKCEITVKNAIVEINKIIEKLKNDLVGFKNQILSKTSKNRVIKAILSSA